MKLSEAILLGSTLLKPKGGSLFTGNDSGCALGMAHKASGLKDTEAISLTWPWVMENGNWPLPCGCYEFLPNIIRGAGIVHIFDLHVDGDHTWTIERLVDYVRSIEPPETEPVEPSTVNTIEAVLV